ncbi:MAG TPA: imidazole glycerol phosphate synthase subunit HisH [Myxococcales bacterium]
MKVTVVDLGLGNLGSVLQALKRAGGEPALSDDPAAVERAPRIVLPGVAAFGLGMQRAERFVGALRGAARRGTPLLGVCLGMQILFERGEEDGERAGIGLLPGSVRKLPETVQTPHIGWQKLLPLQPSALSPRGWAYFAHSYAAQAPDDIVQATVEHGGARIAAVVGRGSVFGVQYHPEKSAKDGEELLQRFLALPEAA